MEAADFEVRGGSTLLREAVSTAILDTGEHGVLNLSRFLGVRAVVVICDRDEHWESLSSLAAEPNVCPIAIIRDLHVDDFVRALRAGAKGVIWEDTPTTHLLSVIEAGLRDDVMLPYAVLETIMSDRRTRPGVLDTVDETILRHIADGRSTAEIAEAMHFSKRTVQRRLLNLCLRLDATNPAQVVHRAHELGYL